jgi:hypothetical protein
MNRKIKIPEGLDRPALNAWWYVMEAVKACRDAIEDYEFASLMLHMYTHYPKELEFLLLAERGGK